MSMSSRSQKSKDQYGVQSKETTRGYMNRGPSSSSTVRFLTSMNGDLDRLADEVAAQFCTTSPFLAMVYSIHIKAYLQRASSRT